ncbi:MAG: heparinase II/III family protein [Paludibacter sp.]|jgi:hypothetical protein|nr:heparinase II/III family protein [Paludibacter sp.]
MNNFNIVTAFFLLFSFNISAQNSTPVLKVELPTHPRILLLEGEEDNIRNLFATGTLWSTLHTDILKESDRIIGLPLLERKQIGMRLLAVSREALRRIFFLSYSYRMTEDGKYAQRAEQEMLAVSDFRDWNPSHFLDVAEMTMGVAIGYDWLYHQLSDESRGIIRDAIIEKGLNPSLNEKHNWWLDAKHNWNQVCNAGITFGALAVYEHNPEFSRSLISRSATSIAKAMHDYAPHGAYPEGYAYWEYGTSFNVLFLSVVEKAYNSDFGLSAIDGFMGTSGYYQHMIGATNKSFNYSDCGDEFGLTPAMFWFADKSKTPSLLWNEINYLNPEYRKNHLANRLLPSVMIWAKDIATNNVEAPAQLVWTGGGTTPVALMRSSWTNPNAIYVGFKGGTAESNHAHMDVGSFIMEANGERWAMDFGKQDYQSLESKKLQIWTNNQESERWKVFRYNNFVHNTLTVNDKMHNVKGYAPLLAHSDNEKLMYASADISSLFAGELKSAKRAVAIISKKYVVVRDAVTATADKEAVVQWRMLTDATVQLIGKNKIVLTKNGKTLKIKVNSKLPLQMKTWSTQSPNDYDADNSGTTLVGFELTVPAGESSTFDVSLIPEKQRVSCSDKRLLNKWEFNSCN